jgi:hypothetical protein
MVVRREDQTFILEDFLLDERAIFSLFLDLGVL